MRRLNPRRGGARPRRDRRLLPIWRPVDPGLDAPDGVVGNAPPGITAALRDMARPDDRLFNPQPWGSWFEFALPALPVAIDSRIELFPPDVWDDYEAVVDGGDGWEAQLDAWGVSSSCRREGRGVRRPARGRRLAIGLCDDDGSSPSLRR